MRRKPGFWVLLSLVALLCFLGYLQYVWIDRLARADQEREQQSLRAALHRIAGAFDAEITRAQLAFGPGSMRDGRRFVGRRGDGPGPGRRPDGPPPPPPPSEEDHLEDEALWADRAQMWLEFAPYPRLIKEVYVTNLTRTLRVASSGVTTVSSAPQNAIDPVSIVPGGGGEVRYIVYDREFIRQDLLPRIIGRHLDLQRYGVRIASGDQPIYSHNEFTPADSTRLFAFRPECFASGPMRRDFRRRGPPSRGDAAAFLSRSDITCEDAPKGFDPGRWTLDAGLVKTAGIGFGEFRTRSLLLSFGVLAVLATGIGMLGLYWHRAQVLAQRQMEFAMAVSHELRTPLTVIRVAADSLAEGMVTEPRKYGDLIRKETIRLSDMVEQVLVFARTQRADIQPQFEAVAPEDVIGRAVSAVAPALDRAGLSVHTDVAEGVPALRADANLLSAALQNLLINAAKYAASGKIVRIKAERAESAHVRILVQDEGPGVSSGDLPRVFSAFYRAAAASNSNVPGLGLGLHLVKRIVDAHGGTVRAANRHGAYGFEVDMRIPAVES
ncbi:MAG TPA: ATP-binding protein [Bryobacteraceae bacterium]|nr:ATP-binding protein [Bryobacteraceae bacterium]